jgi:hypothetical protein
MTSRPPGHLLVPGCEAVLPLDAGQAFAGPRFLIREDSLALFEPAGPGNPGLKWRLAGAERLPAAPPAVGLDRGWGRGRVLLVATADPRTCRYRVLLEAVQPDHRGPEILCEYPDRDFPRWFDQISPVASSTLLTGFESVQIQEYIVLFNPLAHRVFVYQAMNGTIREAALDTADSPDDPCWQVLPRSNAEARVALPGSIGPACASGLKAIALGSVSVLWGTAMRCAMGRSWPSLASVQLGAGKNACRHGQAGPCRH